MEENPFNINNFGDILSKLSRSTLLPPAIDFPQPHRRKTIDAGATETIYNETFPNGMVGFLRELAIEWDENGKTWFYIDGKLWLDDFIDFQIGSVDDPIILEPPYLVRNSMRIDIYNGTDDSTEFRVYVGGLLFNEKPKEDVFTPQEEQPNPIDQAIEEILNPPPEKESTTDQYLLPPEMYETQLEEAPSDLPPSPYSLAPPGRKKLVGEPIYDATR